MVEGRKPGTSGELKKCGISWQLDSSTASAIDSSKPSSTCTTPKAANNKRSASSLATSLINSLGGGSLKKTEVPICGWESPTLKSTGSSFTTISSSNSFSAGASAAAICNAAAARPASPSVAVLHQPSVTLIKSNDTSSLSWSGISSTTASAAPVTGLASLTDPGSISLSRLTHKPGQASKLLPDAVFIPDCVAHKHAASTSNVTFLEPATSDDGNVDELYMPGASQCSSGGSKIGPAQLMRLGSSSLAVVPSQRTLSGATPNSSAAGGGAEAMLRQKSRVSLLIDEDIHAALGESFGSGAGASGAVQPAGFKNGNLSSSDYKRSNTTGLIGMTVKVDDLKAGGFSGDPDDSNRCTSKRDILAVVAKLTSASVDINGVNSSSDSKVQALAYKHQVGYVPSPSASSAGNRQSLKQITSGKSNLPWAGKAALHIANDDEEKEGDGCLLPALPPGAIPSFTAAGSNTAGSSNNSSNSSTSNIRSHAAAVNSAKALSPSAMQQNQQPSLLEDNTQQQHSVQLSVTQIPKTLELLPPHVTEPTLLAVSGRLAPAMQRSNWCMADFVTQKKLYEGYASTILKAYDKVSGSTVALKLYHLNKLNTISSHQVAREVRLHIGLDHENIIALYAAFQEAGNVVLVQEFASSGDLWSFIDVNSGRLTERATVSLVLQPFLKAIQYLHSAGIAHRDIKPENVLFTSNMVLKVADFGLAVNLREERAVTRVGTLDYMAPEVLRCPLKRYPGDNKDRADLHYSQAVDAWAVGVLAYELLIGRAPFSAVGTSDSAIEAAIQCGSPAFPSRMSDPAVDFIATALEKHPDRRPSILQMLHHAWIRSFQRSSSNGRAEQRSSQEYGGTGRLQLPNSTSTAQPAIQQQQQQQDRLPQLTPPKGHIKKDLSSADSHSANVAAAGVYHSDDNGMTGYAISGGW